jgi:hypothetical protein
MSSRGLVGPGAEVEVHDAALVRLKPVELYCRERPDVQAVDVARIEQGPAEFLVFRDARTDSQGRQLDTPDIEESICGMATLSFHAPSVTARRIRAAARKRGIPVSRFLRETAERAAAGEPVSGLGRELEKLAIDGMAIAALSRIRSRAADAGLDKMTPTQITAVIKATRRARA